MRKHSVHALVVLSLGGAILLSQPDPAEAGKAHDYGNVATAYWGPAPPPCGRVTFRRVSLQEAQAAVKSSSPDIVATADPSTCRINFVEADWRASDDYRRCEIVAHEYGHLYWRDHSDDARDVMASTGPSQGFYPCTRAVELQERRTKLKFRWNKAVGRR